MGFNYNGLIYGFAWPLIWIFIWLFFLRGHGHHSRHHDDCSSSAKDILSDRFAKGEIDEKEYEKRLITLKKA